MAARKPRRRKVERGLYIRGKTYYACVRPRGAPRPFWKSLGAVGIMEARRKRDEFAVEMRNGGFVPLDRGALVDDVAVDALREIDERIRRGRLSRRTGEAYRSSTDNHVVPFFRGRPVLSITPDDIAEWVVEQENSDAAAWSIRAHWTALRMVFKHAHRKGLIPSSPADALKSYEKPGPGRARQRFLDDVEIQALFAAARTRKERMLLGLLVFCGLRASETLGLNWSEMDFKGRWVKARFQMSRDGERVPIKSSETSDAGPRDIVMMDDLAKLGLEFRMETRFSSEEDLVLTNTLGNTWGYWELLATFTEIRKRAGLSDDVSPHPCRHTFASILIDQGRPVEYVSRQLGHAKTSTTYDVYVHLFRRREHAEAARDGLNRGYGGILRGS